MLSGRLLATVCALLVGGLIAACGSSSSGGVTASAYAKSICSAVGPFEKDVATHASALNLANIHSAAQGKTALQGFLSAIAADTRTAVGQLKAAGSPNVAHGHVIASSIVAAFTHLQNALGHASTQAQSLPTSSPTAFKTAANALGLNVRSSMGSISASLNGLKSPALEQAARKVPACQTL